MAYRNPVPSFDDERTSDEWGLFFRFDDYVSAHEAAEGIMEHIKKNGIGERQMCPRGSVRMRCSGGDGHD